MPAKNNTPALPRVSRTALHPDGRAGRWTSLSLWDAEGFVRTASRSDMTVQEWEITDREGRPLRIVRADYPRTDWWEGWPDWVLEFTAWHKLVGQV